ncbi:MAG: biotin transporter BioY [Treponema sp.]|jgi:biotin transport system substrate-specific component|nr:biotin transporter BioY [Treponema sp.]
MERNSAVSSQTASRKTILNITLIALFGALTAGGNFIAIPFPGSPVPIALQNMFALLSGLILGPLLGGAAVGLFLLAGVLGAPVFAGATGGFARFLGPTGGFLIGYLLAAIVAGLVAGRPSSRHTTPVWRIGIAAFAGMAAVYIPGVIWLKFVLDDTWLGAIGKGFLPFIIGDGIKGIAAGIIAPRLRRVVADNLDG